MIIAFETEMPLIFENEMPLVFLFLKQKCAESLVERMVVGNFIFALSQTSQNHRPSSAGTLDGHFFFQEMKLIKASALERCFHRANTDFGPPTFCGCSRKIIWISASQSKLTAGHSH